MGVCYTVHPADQKTTCSTSQFFFSTKWVPGIELRSLGLEASSLPMKPFPHLPGVQFIGGSRIRFKAGFPQTTFYGKSLDRAKGRRKES